jgi:ferrous iron transport protein B
MATSCCSPSANDRVVGAEFVACLAGNPNVGKSSIYNGLTGSNVETANYAGMTVALASSPVTWAGTPGELIDLPGTYALGSVSADQHIARRGLLERRPDVVIAVVDATNLARNLFIVLQLLDLGYRVVVALNLIDEAHRQRLAVDSQALAEALGVPVVRTVAPIGAGLPELATTAAAVATSTNGVGRGRRRTYSAGVEARVAALIERLDPRPDGEPLPHGLSTRAFALALLEGDAELATEAGLSDIFAELRAESPDGDRRVLTERHALARAIAAASTEPGEPRVVDRWWRATTSPLTGLPILAGVLAVVFAVLFFVGSLLSNLLTSGWNATMSPLVRAIVFGLVGHGVVGRTLLWSLDGGVLAALAVGIPYILTFYFMLALLEDSGYMNAAAFLGDRVMHRFGLHGRAMIPLIASAGCNVPAIIGTRVLSSMRERVIASTLATLVPCSARTAVIIGAVALYAGWQWALFVYAVVFLVGFVAGLLLNRMLPGDTDGLVMEMFPFRRPSLRLVARKTWRRFRDFVWVAAPIILGGSLVLGALYESGAIWRLAAPLSPIVEGWLGLPAVAGLTLIFAVLRKELALQLLVAFAVVRYGTSGHSLLSFMTPHQIVVYALVNSIYIPCVATIAMLGHELGWRRAALISSGTVVAALVVGGVTAQILALL